MLHCNKERRYDNLLSILSIFLSTGRFGKNNVYCIGRLIIQSSTFIKGTLRACPKHMNNSIFYDETFSTIGKFNNYSYISKLDFNIF